MGGSVFKTVLEGDTYDITVKGNSWGHAPNLVLCPTENPLDLDKNREEFVFLFGHVDLRTRSNGCGFTGGKPSVQNSMTPWDQICVLVNMSMLSACMHGNFSNMITINLAYEFKQDADMANMAIHMDATRPQMQNPNGLTRFSLFTFPVSGKNDKIWHIELLKDWYIDGRESFFARYMGHYEIQRIVYPTNYIGPPMNRSDFEARMRIRPQSFQLLQVVVTVHQNVMKYISRNDVWSRILEQVGACGGYVSYIAMVLGLVFTRKYKNSVVERAFMTLSRTDTAVDASDMELAQLSSITLKDLQDDSAADDSEQSSSS